MTRHGKNCTAGAVYTYHEKKKDTGTGSGGGHVSQRHRFSLYLWLCFPCVSLPQLMVMSTYVTVNMSGKPHPLLCRLTLVSSPSRGQVDAYGQSPQVNKHAPIRQDTPRV